MKLACAFVLLSASVAPAADTNKTRIFLVGSQPLQLAGDATVGDTDASLQIKGGNSKEYVEVMRNFMKHCPEVVITNNRDRAEYVVRVEHEGANPGTLFERGNKVAIFDKDEDLIYATSTHFLSSAVKDACKVLVSRR